MAVAAATLLSLVLVVPAMASTPSAGTPSTLTSPGSDSYHLSMPAPGRPIQGRNGLFGAS
jgi:hypothetical protein